MSQTTVSTGGFTAFHPPTPQDLQEFAKIQTQLLGVKYTPLLVASQLVAGTIYRYACTSEVVSPNPVYGLVTVETFQPLGAGQPIVRSIQQLLS